jgi:hypothetical protein
LDASDLATFYRTEQEAENSQNNENKKQDLGYAHGASGDAAKAEQGRNQSDDKKYNGVMQPGRSPVE